MVATPTTPTTPQDAAVIRALAADPADKVIVEGYPTVRSDFAGITVHVTSATTTGLQASKRAAQQVTGPAAPSASPHA